MAEEKLRNWRNFLETDFLGGFEVADCDLRCKHRYNGSLVIMNKIYQQNPNPKNPEESVSRIKKKNKKAILTDWIFENITNKYTTHK